MISFFQAGGSGAWRPSGGDRGGSDRFGGRVAGGSGSGFGGGFRDRPSQVPHFARLIASDFQLQLITTICPHQDGGGDRWGGGRSEDRFGGILHCLMFAML